MISIKAWLVAARLRTLPLALSSIGVGGILAYKLQNFDWVIFSLCILTTLLLQILSNFANDYGDYVHGADSNVRKGPERMVQSGTISANAMKTAMLVMALLSLLSGLSLLYFSIPELSWLFVGFLVLGILSIAAAIKYTAGANPYGYMGLGDIFVFVFFGPVAVLGTCFLQTQYLAIEIVLPAISMGLFATGVLNVNNIRDIDSDKEGGKMSIPVRIGKVNAKIYHSLLIGVGIFLSMYYTITQLEDWQQFLPILSVPFFLYNVVIVWKREGKELDSMLKQLVISILIFSILFSIGVYLK